MARIAGGSVLSLREFLERSQGAGSFARALDGAPADEVAPLREIILPVNWYPTTSFLAVLHAGRALAGGDDYYERYGAFAAEYEIAAFQRFLLRFTTPVFLMDRAGRLWRRFHDTGEWEVEGDPRQLRGTLRGFSVVDASYCRVLAAWIKRAAHMTGVTGDIVHPECRAHGAEAEVFQGWWK